MRKKFKVEENRDAGMALMLLMLLIRLIGNVYISDWILIFILIITILIPGILYPFSFIWYNFSHFLGNIISFIFLNVIYWFIVFPIALIRHLMGKDSLLIRKFRRTNSTVFIERNYTFTQKDMLNTF